MIRLVLLLAIVNALGCDSKQSSQQTCAAKFTTNTCIEPINSTLHCCISKFQVVGVDQCDYLLKSFKPTSRVDLMKISFVDQNYQPLSCNS